ncbi:unnamed protein product, partial [Vitis vinifera]
MVHKEQRQTSHHHTHELSCQGSGLSGKCFVHGSDIFFCYFPAANHRSFAQANMKAKDWSILICHGSKCLMLGLACS